MMKIVNVEIKAMCSDIERIRQGPRPATAHCIRLKKAVF
jgi:hypothetical protein